MVIRIAGVVVDKPGGLESSVPVITSQGIYTSPKPMPGGVRFVGPGLIGMAAPKHKPR